MLVFQGASSEGCRSSRRSQLLRGGLAFKVSQVYEPRLVDLCITQLWAQGTFET